MLYTLHDGEWFPVGDVCPVCVAADPEGAAKRMREYAELLRTRAGELEATADRVDWQTVASEINANPETPYLGSIGKANDLLLSAGIPEIATAHFGPA